MARAFTVKSGNITVDPGTKGLRPDGSSGAGRDWPEGSIVELSDPAEIAGLVAVGAIEPLAEKAAPAQKAEEPAPKPAEPVAAPSKQSAAKK